jgi:hypothetical protein
MSFRSLVLLPVLLAFPSISQALTLDCQVKTNTGSAVTERYIFQVEDGADEAIVSDGLILYYNDNQPMTAKVSENTAKKLVFTWSVQMTNRTGQMTKMQFRASYFKADKSILVRAVPGGVYTNNFEGRGRCKSV